MTTDPGPTRHDAITLTHADTITIFAAADIAAADKRNRAAMPRLRRPVVPRLPGPHPGRRRLRPDGRPHAPGRQATPAASASEPAPDRWSQPAADREAGQ
jgi:hypothetical protein